jgi:lipid-A-disaccharide synthase
MRRLDGPPCSYVGHPLLERLPELRPTAPEQAARDRAPPLVLVMPGSRRSELGRLAAIFGAAIGRLAAERPIDLVVPTLPALAGELAAAVEAWPVRPRVITGESEKFAAFRRARAALAASGTATLELALAGVPMVTAYRGSLLEELVVRTMVFIDTPILPNLILGEKVVPCFLQRDCTAENLSTALVPLLAGGVERQRQLDAFARLDGLLDTGGEAPSARAARVVMEAYEGKRRHQTPRQFDNRSSA